MLARTRLKLKNAEKSINFMQDQHAIILEGLHQEIDQLQKKNARLAFQLTMNGGEILTGKEDNKIQEVLVSTGSELAKVKLLLSKEQQKVTLLQNQVDDIMSKHNEELLVKDDSIKKLNTELDSKAEVIVMQTQQIYRLRAKLKQESDNTTNKSATCSCPHCYIHSKISPEARVLLNTPTQGPGTPKKQIIRTSDIRQQQRLLDSPSIPDTPPGRYPKKNLVPIPPPSSPPLSASGRRRPIFKIASKPDIRTLPLTADARNEISNTHENTMLQDSSAGEITRRQSQPTQNQVQSIMRLRNPKYENSHRRRSSRDSEDDNTPLSSWRTSTSTLPPIVAPPIVAPSTTEEQLCDSEMDKLPEATFSQHHRKASYLNKFPGLSSAPPASASLHVLRRSSRQRGQGSMMAAVGMSEEDVASPEQPEGMLLVKENDEKTSDSSWANGTHALDSVQ